MKNIFQTSKNDRKSLKVTFFLNTFLPNRFVKFVLLMTLFLAIFSQKAKAQFLFNVNNNTGCTYTITAFDASTMQIGSAFTASPGVSVFSNIGSTPIEYLEVTKTGCSFLTFGVAGVFSFSSQSTTCSPPTCNATIDCQGAAQNGFCFMLYMYGTININ